MSVTIETVSISSISDKRIVLDTDTYAAILSVGSAWTRIRFGWRWAQDDAGASLTLTPRLYWGLLADPVSGIPNGPLGTTTNFRGKRTINATYTRQAGPPVHYSPTFQDILKVGATVTSTDAIGFRISGEPATFRSAMMCEYVKTSATTITMQQLYPSTAVAMVDVSYALLRQALLATSLAGAATMLNTALGVTGYTNSSVSNKTVDEATNGYFNSFCFAWDRNNALPHISEILLINIPS